VGTARKYVESADRRYFFVRQSDEIYRKNTVPSILIANDSDYNQRQNQFFDYIISLEKA